EQAMGRKAVSVAIPEERPNKIKDERKKALAYHDSGDLLYSFFTEYSEEHKDYLRRFVSLYLILSNHS
ncbi:MAG: hypothetical protein J1E78_05380, partial [Muribaculaceae bacterium]|nr:hypothetical protein [Muribaculaceae bacterium]